jgi:DNA-binding CsgD family transcriptional regulator
MPPALALVRPTARAERVPSYRPPLGGVPVDSRQALWKAALEADENNAAPCPLEAIWDDHLHGRLRAWWESIGPDRVVLVARVAEGGVDLAAEDADILARVLSGQQQKLVASDLGIAPSTVSGRYVRALDKLDLTPSTIPVPLVLAAQAKVGVAKIPPARSAFFEVEGHVCMVISVPRPNMSCMKSLTAAEQEVAAWLVEGCSRFDIARYRKTSVHTVARQFHSIFAGQGVTGRFALIRSAVAVDCFAETSAAPERRASRRDSGTEEMLMADAERRA